MASKNDDIFLDFLDDLKTHEGQQIVRRHIEQERERTINEVAGKRLEPLDTEYKRGFLAGLNFCLEAPNQVYQLRVTEIESDQPKKGKR